MDTKNLGRMAYSLVATIAAVELTVAGLLCLASPFLAVVYAATHVVDLYELALTAVLLVSLGTVLLLGAGAMGRAAGVFK